jgi:hypothetical protein
MYCLQSAWEWLLPTTEDALLRGRAELVSAACLALILASLALVLIWAISRDLDRDTVFGMTVLSLVLLGIGFVAREGRVSLAAGALVALATVIITSRVALYGLASVTASAYVLPIVLAAGALGLGAGLALAVVSSAITWFLAWGEAAGRRKPVLPTQDYHLTFNAPTLTVVFVLTALLAGF